MEKQKEREILIKEITAKLREASIEALKFLYMYLQK